MDIWLTKLWASLHRQDLRYIPSQYLLITEGPQPLEAMRKFRKLFDLPQTGPCPFQTVVGFLHVAAAEESTRGNHYTIFLLNPENKCIHILGRLYQSNNSSIQTLDQVSWGLQSVAYNILHLHGWPLDLDFNVYEVNWKQNGFDCGPIVCHMLEYIWIHGFHLSQQGHWAKAPLTCCHSIRRRMASDFHALAWYNLQTWDTLVSSSHPLDMEVPALEACKGLILDFRHNNPPNPGASLHPLLNKMDLLASKCKSCNRSKPPPTVAFNNPPSSPHIPLAISSHIPLEAITSPLFMKPINKPSMVPQPLKYDNNGRKSPTHSPPSTLSRNARKQDHSIPHKYAMDRFPRPISPPFLPHLKNHDKLFLGSDITYDDYDTGPTSEVLDPIPDTVLQFGEINLVYLADRITANPWMTFRDYGYRLLPLFAHAFQRINPIMTHKHLMPAVLLSESLQSSQILLNSRHGHSYDVHDTLVLGPTQLINLAKDSNDNKIFLTGRTPLGQYITLDLQEDSPPHDSVETTKVIDIDSIIWVTRYPRFRCSIGIYTKPVIRGKPPIFKHNHLFVDLLMPQSEEDKLYLGPRQEWVTRRIKLCNIPHVYFGKTGDGPTSCNLYMAFPRMFHKHPYLNRHESMVPPYVQQILWEQIIIPAMVEATPDVSHPYVGLDISHQSVKGNAKGTSQQATSYPFRPTELKHLISSMDRLVSTTISTL